MTFELGLLVLLSSFSHLASANETTINYFNSNFKYRDFEFYHQDFPMPENQAPEQYFEQTLDHFDPSNKQTWKQVRTFRPDFSL